MWACHVRRAAFHDTLEARSVAHADLGIPRVLGCRAPAQVGSSVVCVVAIDVVDTFAIVGVGVVGLTNETVHIVALQFSSCISTSDN